MTSNRKVPVLRFPGFTGEWDKKNLEQVSENIMYGLNTAAIPYDGKNKYIRITDIDEELRIFNPNPLSSPDGIINRRCKVEEGDILFTRTGASVGKSYLYHSNDGDLYFAGFLIRFNISKAIPYFVFAQTLTAIYDNWVRMVSMRSGQPGINAEEYKALTIWLASTQEQQKIASFLTSIDDKIQQLTKKKTLLEQYKKGLMQQLFSRQLRFKDDDGNDYPDWEEKQIGGFAPLQRGFDLPVDDIKEGPFPVVFSNGILKTHSEYKVKSPGIVTGRSGTIGRVTYVEKNFWPHNTTLWVTDFKGNFPKYIYYFYLQINLERFSTGSGVPTLNRNNIHLKQLLFPFYDEQKKIADCLTSIDNKLSIIIKQVDDVKQYKKGLLQQLFI